MSRELRLRALEGLPEIRPGDDLAALLDPLVPRGPGVLALAQKIVSKAEDRLVALADLTPSPRAEELARRTDKDPRRVEIVLRESVRVLRAVPGVLICETRHGFVCANAGVDFSNSPGEEVAVLLPLDPDASARRLRAALGNRCAVLITDTFGRPWREGLVDVAIGCAGLPPLVDLRGGVDREGRPLQVTVMALADELAAAAGMLMGKAEGHPAVWIEGAVPHSEGGEGGAGSARQLVRDPERDLFRS